MCGIAGFIDVSACGNAAQLADLAQRMATTLRHRGPDDAGSWCDPAAGVALGHRRLSIVDLSHTGHQPMMSASGRWVLVYNGEVYNHASLRGELEQRGVTFRGRSDTEVLVEAIDAWGMRAALSRCIGMFALAAWDTRERRLVLARDRLGIKPLYLAPLHSSLLFGSEIKALRAHPHFDGELDRGSLALYLRHGYIPAPYSIYRRVRKLEPGTIQTIRVSSNGLHVESPEVYWSFRDIVERGRRQPFSGMEREAIDQLEALLRDAVGIRMLADVPVGAFLSGGIDSSLIVALMQSQRSEPVRTFCVGFDEDAYNEAPFARAIAQHLGTQHVEYRVSAEETREAIPRLAGLFDEPFGDSSAIPTFLISRLTRQHVKVSLSGDGGDELFAGYERYRYLNTYWRRIRRWPRVLRCVGAALLSPLEKWNRKGRWARRARTMSHLLPARGGAHLYSLLHTHWRPFDQVVLHAAAPPHLFGRPEAWPAFGDPLESMMYIDTVTYLPDDVLTKVDRASMAVGLEARVPLLDHRIVEWAWTLPVSWKQQAGQSKWILRHVLERYVPRGLFERPKAGFSIPLASWLRGPLRPWAEELLDARRLEQEGWLDPAPIRLAWEDHLTGVTDWSHLLWDVLMFQDWLARSPRSLSSGGA